MKKTCRKDLFYENSITQVLGLWYYHINTLIFWLFVRQRELFCLPTEKILIKILISLKFTLFIGME